MRIALFVLVLAGFAGLQAPRPGVAQDEYLLPNLVALPAHDIHIAGDELRFATTSWNNGAIALELHGGDNNGTTQVVTQRVFNLTDGVWDNKQVGTAAIDDDHDHFHIAAYASYQLFEAGNPNDPNIRAGSKTTFCIIDTDRIDHKLPSAPKRPVYTKCGLDQGMSVGWGDTYGSHLPGQSIDIQTVETGDYTLRITINPMGKLWETTDADNVAEVQIHIDREAGTVTVIGESGDEPSGPGRGNGRGRP